jgi:hypothetical protein
MGSICMQKGRKKGGSEERINMSDRMLGENSEFYEFVTILTNLSMWDPKPKTLWELFHQSQKSVWVLDEGSSTC